MKVLLYIQVPYITALICVSLLLLEALPRDVFPVKATIVTHTEYAEINKFCANQNGLKDVKLIQDKVNIYRLCHSMKDVVWGDFAALSHLSVSTMLNVIQVYNVISGNIDQSKQLLLWTRAEFVDVCADIDVSKMLIGT